ncbi:LLM class flavin-dependent oxidoreductase [Brevibacillus laterosporus]|uniref:LLM class flavin-dependent oxidoreductase n=1 Tax=Brevibacillus halotolerans TaxID=1507437 RepID=A0ABT4HUS7_9BACL|nr:MULTISPECIES: MupA/Atu3671 family FMN-dependent luciferase-like monooxygenase [Brevibacillus]MCR8984823.1 LLM class flavin-dependent oxidoreductase [Brevibacillus laterosporus]MCZ0830550.1 LLM class flavin-dependent oxidoreductase [Brevibacillus halotolerans]
MNQLDKRLAALSPEQRVLFEQRLKQKGIQTPFPTRLSKQEVKNRNSAASSFVPKRKRKVDKMEFSLFFFSGDGSTQDQNKYALLLESTAYADQHGFAGVWTPERHFEDFGGLYPNPSVLSAALATITERIELRAGSVVLPLHHPIRFVEEWSVVDNLSKGRVSVAFATGWHPADFVIAPVQTPDYYESRKDEMFNSIELVKRLWAGEQIPFTDVNGAVHEIRTLPRPLQNELNIWIATNGSADTYERAAKIGANILTGITAGDLADLEAKIELYRKTLSQSGFSPESRKVAVMLHTCLGTSDEEVKAKVEKPMKEYLKTFMKQQKNILTDYASMSASDFNVIVDHAFESYFQESALFGSHDKCKKLIETLGDIDVDEVACLVDFGIDNETIMNSIRMLTDLKQSCNQKELTL